MASGHCSNQRWLISSWTSLPVGYNLCRLHWQTCGILTCVMCMFWLFHIVIFGIILIHWSGAVVVVSALQSLVALEIISMTTLVQIKTAVTLLQWLFRPGACTRTYHIFAIMRLLQCYQCQDSMRQINRNGFQSLRYSMYDYDFVAINIFEFEFDVSLIYFL